MLVSADHKAQYNTTSDVRAVAYIAGLIYSEYTNREDMGRHNCSQDSKNWTSPYSTRLENSHSNTPDIDFALEKN